MVKLTDYDTLQAYVDATLAMDGPPKKKNKYDEEGQMQTPQKMRTMQKPKQNRKKGQ